MKRSIFLLIILLLIAPRVVRIACPYVQIEDPNYIYGAYLMTLGDRPFIDFAQPNPPLLESIVSIFYLLFGVSHRVPEVLTALAYLATALIIRRLGLRWFSGYAGNWAAILYSYHFLLFRYHLFEREVFATLAVAAGMDLFFRKTKTPSVDLLAGIVIGIGFACKQTALIPFLAFMMAALICRHSFQSLIRVAAGFLGLVAGLSSIYLLLYGNSYIDQIFWFHFIKGTVAPWNIKAVWTLSGLGFLVPLIIGSTGWLTINRKSMIWTLFAMIAADLVFFWFVSGAFWPHYLLSSLLPASLLAGLTIDKWIEFVRNKKVSAKLCVSIGMGLVTLIAMIVYSPGALVGSMAADKFGFSGTPREAVNECAEFIRENTLPEEVIIADPFIALESHRKKLIRFKDNWGLILWMNGLMEKGQYREAVKQLNKSSFAEVRKKSQDYWMPMVKQAFYQNRVGAVQPNYELPIHPDTLRKLDFTKGFTNKYYQIWIRPKK